MAQVSGFLVGFLVEGVKSIEGLAVTRDENPAGSTNRIPSLGIRPITTHSIDRLISCADHLICIVD